LATEFSAARAFARDPRNTNATGKKLLEKDVVEFYAKVLKEAEKVLVLDKIVKDWNTCVLEASAEVPGKPLVTTVERGGKTIDMTGIRSKSRLQMVQGVKVAARAAVVGDATQADPALRGVIHAAVVVTTAVSSSLLLAPSQQADDEAEALHVPAPLSVLPTTAPDQLNAVYLSAKPPGKKMRVEGPPQRAPVQCPLRGCTSARHGSASTCAFGVYAKARQGLSANDPLYVPRVLGEGVAQAIRRSFVQQYPALCD
jgi:hypothetical protein